MKVIVDENGKDFMRDLQGILQDLVIETSTDETEKGVVFSLDPKKRISK